MVTYKSAAKPAAQIMEDIGKQAGVKIQLEEPLDKDILIVRLNKVPFNTALDKIATVLHAKWSMTKNGIYIGRESFDAPDESAKIEKCKDEFVAAVADREKSSPSSEITPSIAKQIAQSILQPTYIESDDPDASEKADYNRARMTPQQRLIDRVLPSIDPKVVAEHCSDNEMVFSTAPKSLQFKLDLSNEDITAIVDEQNMWSQAAYDERKTLGYHDDPPQLISAAPRVVCRVGHSTPTGADAWTVEVWLLDSIGSALAYGAGNVSGYKPFFSNGASAEKPDPFKSMTFDRVKLTGVGLEMNLWNQTGMSDPSPALKATILDPEHHDPLALIASQWLLGAADQKDWNLVAWPDDTLSFLTSRAPYDSIDPQRMLTTMTLWNSTKIDLKDGWLTISPTDPTKDEADMLDRASMAEAFRKIDSAKHETLDADLLLFGGNPHRMFIASRWMRYLTGNDSVLRKDRPEALSIYRTLDSSTLNRLLRGDKVRFSELTADQRTAFLKLINVRYFGDNERADLSAPVEPFDDYTQEVNSLDDPQIYVWAAVSEQPALAVRMRDKFTRSQTEPVFLHELGTVGLTEHLANMLIAPTTLKGIAFTLHFADNVEFGASCYEGGEVGKYGRIQDLPDDSRKAIEKMIEEEQKWRQDRPQRERNKPPLR